MMTHSVIGFLAVVEKVKAKDAPALLAAGIAAVVLFLIAAYVQAQRHHTNFGAGPSRTFCGLAGSAALFSVILGLQMGHV